MSQVQRAPGSPRLGLSLHFWVCENLPSVKSPNLYSPNLTDQCPGCSAPRPCRSRSPAAQSMDGKPLIQSPRLSMSQNLVAWGRRLFRVQRSHPSDLYGARPVVCTILCEWNLTALFGRPGCDTLRCQHTSARIVPDEGVVALTEPCHDYESRTGD